MIKYHKSLIWFVTSGLLAAGLCASYLEWRPVLIVGIHHRSSGFSDVLVTSLPLSDKAKIRWWLNHQDEIKDLYNVPAPEPDGTFDVTFWRFGEGYKEEGQHDCLCFDDMRIKARCIEKNSIFEVSNSRNYGLVFESGKSRYRLVKNGDIEKFDW